MKSASLSSALLVVLASCSGPSTPDPVTPTSGGGDDTQTATPVAQEDPPQQPDPGPVASPQDAFDAECRVGLENAKAKLDEILAVEGERNLDNTVVAFDELMMHLETSWGYGLLFRNVHPDESFREVAAACEADVKAFFSDLGRNRALYDAFAALDASGYTPAAKRIVEHTLRDFRRAGVDKDDATRARLKAIDDEDTLVGQQFQKNISDDVKTVMMDPAELDGLPQDWIDSHPAGKDGKVAVTTNYPDLFPFMKYAKSSDAKKRLFTASRSVAKDTNPAVIKRMLELRWEKANLLGYKNYADYYIEDKMMKTGDAAAKFIDRAHKLALKRAKKDYKELLKRKRKDDKKAKFVGDWEKTYYEELVKVESYDVDAKEVRQYFEYETVEAGLLAITSEIYDIEYRPAADAKLWHEDVAAYDVYQEGKKLGRIFLDMHPREGKYGHAAQFPLVPGVAGKSEPVGVLVCNFPNPRTSKGPALMEHGDVETMFHEFGHLMHHIFKGQRQWMLLGEVERDFVEAPSQMFEEWAWDYETLKLFAKHHSTGEVIPKELVERMHRGRKFGVGTFVTYQMYYASMVLEFYRRDPAKLDMLALVKKLQDKYTQFDYVDGTTRHTQFGHLRNYPASYYTYMWSLVLAKDLLSPFKKHGLMNKEWTRRYRDKVLAPGGEKDAADLVADFLGRPFNFKAFEKFVTK